MGLNAKMMVYILSTSVLIYLAAVGYISLNLNKMSLDSAKDLADSEASKYANLVKAELDADLFITRTLAQTFLSYDLMPREIWEPFYLQMQKDILAGNPEVLAVATSWEYAAIDSTYTKNYGRMQHGYFRTGNNFELLWKEKNMEGDDIGSPYYIAKTEKKELLMEPYFDSYSGLAEDSMLMASLAVPVVKDGQFIALAGVDIALRRFEKLVSEIRPFDDSYAFLLAHKGSLVGHPDAKLLNRSIAEIWPREAEEYKIIEQISDGNQFALDYTNADNKKYYVSFAPVAIDDIENIWSLGIAVSYNDIMAEANRNFYISIIVGLLGMFVMIGVIWYVSGNITKPLGRATKVLSMMAQGNINKLYKLKDETSDEIGAISNSVNILLDGFSRMSAFAAEIGKGNFDADFERLSQHDQIGNALLEMRKSLKKAKEEEIARKTEEEKQSWATKGYALFAEILRQQYDNLELFSYEVVKQLTGYVNAQMGAMFLINDDDENNKYIYYAAGYAYQTDHPVTHEKIKPGVGLLGRAIKEKESLVLNNLPEDYVKISSGNGQKAPNYVAIVPLVFNDDVFGAIELAAFNEFQPHVVEYLEKQTVSVATTISRVKSNARTSKLLYEMRVKSEELSAQEEMMKMNMAEMQAAQKEAARHAKELTNLLDAVNSISYVAEYDMNGRLIEINDAMLKLVGMKREEMLGRFQGAFNVERKGKDVEFTNFWNDLRAGKNRKILQHINVNGRDMWMSEAYTPIYDDNGKPYKVLNISVDVTEGIENRRQ